MYNAQLPSRAELPSSGQLLRSTIIALVSAAIILVTIVLPSEYAIDPTGIGAKLGLTQMGEIKMELAAEAEADAKAQAADPQLRRHQQQHQRQYPLLQRPRHHPRRHHSPQPLRYWWYLRWPLQRHRRCHRHHQSHRLPHSPPNPQHPWANRMRSALR